MYGKASRHLHDSTDIRYTYSVFFLEQHYLFNDPRSGQPEATQPGIIPVQM